MAVLASMISALLATVQAAASTHGAVFGLPVGGRELDVYVSAGTGPSLVFDEGEWTSLSVAFTLPFDRVDNLRAGATLSKDEQSYSFRLEGDALAAGRVARVTFPAGTDMSTVALDYAADPADADFQTQLVPAGASSPLTFPRTAFVVLSGNASLTTELRAFSTAGGIRALTLGFTSLDGVSSPANHSGLGVSSFRSVKRTAIGWLEFGSGFLPLGPVFSTLILGTSASTRRLAAFDLSNPNTLAEDAQYNPLDVVLIDGPVSFDDTTPSPTPSPPSPPPPTPPVPSPPPPSSPPDTPKKICNRWRKKMNKGKTKDIDGMLLLDLDDDGEAERKLKGYPARIDECKDLKKSKHCKNAYHRDVTTDDGEIERVRLRQCVWSGGKCKEGWETDVTSCITKANVNTGAGRWWDAWGRAVLLGTVIVLPIGGAYKLLRRYQQHKKEPEPKQADCKPEQAVPGVMPQLVSSTV